MPLTSFSENDHGSDGKPLPIWFALSINRPLAFFAGIWTTWTSGRKLKEAEVTANLFGSLTCEPNGEVSAVHPKAMPVILNDPDEWNTWLQARWEGVSILQRPLRDGALEIVGTGLRQEELN